MFSLHSHSYRLMFVLLALAAPLLALAGESGDSLRLTDAEARALYGTVNRRYAGVHDPSIVADGEGQWYIFGSHNAISRSADLQNWTSVGANNLFGRRDASGKVSVISYSNAFHSHAVRTVPVRRGDEIVDQPFKGYDAAAWNCAVAADDGTAWSVSGNMWAPDVLWNEQMGRWCMYLSLNGPKWNSVIILLTADRIEGPYVYEGPVVYSGFRSATNAAISWHHTDLELVLGNQSSLPSRYNLGDRWGDYMPHAIDPCVFFDEDGLLWMFYGSWSGGIFLLRLDSATGLRDYTVTYPLTTDDSGRPLSDPYFGKQIAGGYYVSGEGSYIRYIDGRYRLFVTYGGLEAAGGYTMRTFSSDRPDGPYTDNSGESAVFTRYQLNYGATDACRRGNLLVGAFDGWGFQSKGEVAQGHNSVYVDEQGRAWLVYHTRFNAGGEFFQNRVHRLFTSENGWLLSAPMEYAGEQVTTADIRSTCPFTEEEMAGTYSLLIHTFGLDSKQLAVAKPRSLTLSADGKVTGDYSGSWTLTKGTAYITLNLGSNVYRGVVVEQQVDGSTLHAIGITAASAAGQMVWAYKVLPKWAVAYNAVSLKSPVTSGSTISTHIDLTADVRFGVDCTWSSSVPTVITSEGKYNPADTITSVTLTRRLAAGCVVHEKAFTVRAAKADSLPGDCATGIVAYYDFDSKPVVNRYDESQNAALSKLSSGTAPVLSVDGARIGQVVRVPGGTNVDKTGGYVRMANPLEGHTSLGGFTVSAWMKRTNANDLFGTAWAFTSSLPTLSSSQKRFFLTLGSYVGFTNQTDTFAINYPKTVNNTIAAGEWKLVTLTVDTSAVTLYVNGLKRSTRFESTAGRVMTDFDMQHVFDVVTSAPYLSLGTGNGVAGATADYDDLLVWDRALSAEDVHLLYSLACRVTDFTPGGLTAVPSLPFEPEPSDSAVVPVDASHHLYDLSGRPVRSVPSSPTILIHLGRKELFR